MKPRRVIAETTLPDESVLSLQEHDGRHCLVQDGEEVAGPRTRGSEREMARIACAPFRPARQPKIWLAGIGLGEVLSAVREELPQKRATYYVAEPNAALLRWHAEHVADSPLDGDPRVVLRDALDAGDLAAFEGTLHAVLVHADTAPQLERGRMLFEDRRWLAAVHDALQAGGLLAIASSTWRPQLEGALARCGFETVVQEIDANPKARRPRRHPLWLARKRGR